MAVQWDLVQLVETVTDGLHARAAQDDLEQAVYGIDALDELGLHPLIHQALRNGGLGVWPEQRFPSDRVGRRKRSEGKRCDVVLTPYAQPLEDAEAADTLFAPPDAVALEAAFWLEIKTVSMFTPDGPFPRYSAELMSPVRADMKKLSGDGLIYHAGLLLVLFTSEAEIAEHDLLLWERRAIDRGYPVAPPITRTFPLTDRLGNAHVNVSLFPVRRL